MKYGQERSAFPFEERDFNHTEMNIKKITFYLGIFRVLNFFFIKCFSLYFTTNYLA